MHSVVLREARGGRDWRGWGGRSDRIVRSGRSGMAAAVTSAFMENKKLLALRGFEVTTILGSIAAPYSAFVLGALDSLGNAAANRLTLAIIGSATSLILAFVAHYFRYREEVQVWNDRLTSKDQELEEVKSDRFKRLQIEKIALERRISDKRRDFEREKRDVSKVREKFEDDIKVAIAESAMHAARFGKEAADSARAKAIADADEIREEKSREWDDQVNAYGNPLEDATKELRILEAEIARCSPKLTSR